MQINFTMIRNLLLAGYVKILGYLLPAALRENIFSQVPIGEKHRWMYDRFSLRNLLENHGFNDAQFFEFDVSRIPNFNVYCLDCTQDLTPYKRSSLYCEVVK